MGMFGRMVMEGRGLERRFWRIYVYILVYI
jgi:hypothetical protein